MKRSSRRGLISATLVAAGFSCHAPLTAASPLAALNAGQVACNEIQLRFLLTSMKARSASRIPSTVIVSYRHSPLSYSGTVLTNQFAGTVGGEELPPERVPPEHSLAFDLDIVPDLLLLNPSRSTLPVATLMRLDPATNLVAAGSESRVDLTVSPSPDGESGDTRLAIDNVVLDGASGSASAAGIGRAFANAGLATPCHDEFSSADYAVFALLRRLVRTQHVQWLGGEAYSIAGGRIAVFRDTEPGTYRLQELGGIGATLTLQRSADGALESGRLHLLPRCSSTEQLGCTLGSGESALFVVPPLFAGHEYWSDTDPRIVGVGFDDFGQVWPDAAVDFRALLQDSSWLAPTP